MSETTSKPKSDDTKSETATTKSETTRKPSSDKYIITQVAISRSVPGKRNGVRKKRGEVIELTKKEAKPLMRRGLIEFETEEDDED